MNAHSGETAADSGGRQTTTSPHQDEKTVRGPFFRAAESVEFLTMPFSSPDQRKKSDISLKAAGENSSVDIQGERWVIVRTGVPGADWDDEGQQVLMDEVDSSEVIVLAPDGKDILIQRGVTRGESQSIRLSGMKWEDEDGPNPELSSPLIDIDAGNSGAIRLRAGRSYILIEDTGITIYGPHVNIN